MLFSALLLLSNLLSGQEGPISEKTFHLRIDRVSKMLERAASLHGKTLDIQRKWKVEADDQTRTIVGDKKWYLVVSAAEIKSANISADAFDLILCHEVGHFIGGYPFTDDMMAEREFYSSSEGQADYYATQTCIKSLWREDYPTLLGPIEKAVADKCHAVYTNLIDSYLCRRTVVAIESLSRVFAVQTGTRPRIQTPAAKKVKFTNTWGYPSAQCRIDTLLAGSLCPITQSMSEIPGLMHPQGQDSKAAQNESFRHTCYQGVGQRPGCWFRRL